MKRSNYAKRLVIAILIGGHITGAQASPYFLDMEGNLVKRFYIPETSQPDNTGGYGTSNSPTEPVLVNGSGLKLVTRCTASVPPQTTDWWKSNYKSMVGELRRIVNNNCPVNKPITPSEIPTIMSLSVTVPTSTRLTGTSYDSFAIVWSGTPGSIIPTPVKCVPEITKHIAFGMIKAAGAMPHASGSLSVTCDGPSSVKVAVNRDSPLVADGATISFSITGPAGPSDGSGTQLYSILSTMEQQPSLPGSYTWAVPVTVNYN